MEDESEKILNEPDETADEFDESYLEEPDSETEEIGERKNMVRQLIVSGAILAILMISFGVWWIWSKSSSQTAEEAAAESNVVVSVRAAQVGRKTIAAEVSSVGTIFPAKQTVVSSNASGQIKGLKILQNEFVSRGDLLATIDTRDLQSQKNEAEAILHEARLNVQTLSKSTIPQAGIQSAKDLKDAKDAVDNAKNLYDRRKILYDKGGIALKDLEAAQLALSQAENNLKFVENSNALRSKTGNSLDLQTAQARVSQAEQRINTLATQIDLAEVRAPISGFVVEQTQFEGEYATSGGKILTIAATGEIIVKTQFADTVIPGLKVDDAVAVFPEDIAGEKMSGKVSLISRSSDPTSRATEVWIRLGNGAGRLRVGGAAKVVISENAQIAAIVVPNAAVSLDSAGATTGIVMVISKDNVAHETKVEIGVRTDEFTQIVSGLNGDETIVIVGNYALPDGTNVEIKTD